MAHLRDDSDGEMPIREGDRVEVAFETHPGEQPKESLRGTVTKTTPRGFEFEPSDGSADRWDTYCVRETDRVRVYDDSGVVSVHHPDRGTDNTSRIGQRAETTVEAPLIDSDPDSATDC